jgi:hypothetical protein
MLDLHCSTALEKHLINSFLRILIFIHGGPAVDNSGWRKAARQARAQGLLPRPPLQHATKREHLCKSPLHHYMFGDRARMSAGYLGFLWVGVLR